MASTLVVGTDTYISLADAETYIASVYIPADAEKVAWMALLEANKDILLRRAAKLIDRQPLLGVRVTATQVMEFPRYIYSGYVDKNTKNAYLYDELLAQSIVVPDAVKYAQVEIALAFATGVSSSQRAKLQREGVKSFSLGSLSETYGGTGQASSLAIPSAEARELLKPYLAGSVAIC